MRASNGSSNLMGVTVTAAAATYLVGTMPNYALKITTRLGTPEERRRSLHIEQCHKKDCSSEYCRKRDSNSSSSGSSNDGDRCLKKGTLNAEDELGHQTTCKSNRKKPSWRSLIHSNKRRFKEQVKQSI